MRRVRDRAVAWARRAHAASSAPDGGAPAASSAPDGGAPAASSAPDGGGGPVGSVIIVVALVITAAALAWRGAATPHAPPGDAAAALATMRAYLAAEQAAAAALDAAPLETVTTADGAWRAQRAAALARRRAEGRAYTAYLRDWTADVQVQGMTAWVTTVEIWDIHEQAAPVQRIGSQVRYLLVWDAASGAWRIASASLLRTMPAAPPGAAAPHGGR